ncbi:MAG: hypothetical protein MZV49_15735 [Rhodopseudomonas palustris]|nr:hypothetical protein [Rhodopseudomonas palustris]
MLVGFLIHIVHGALLTFAFACSFVVAYQPVEYSQCQDLKRFARRCHSPRTPIDSSKFCDSAFASESPDKLRRAAAGRLRAKPRQPVRVAELARAIGRARLASPKGRGPTTRSTGTSA